MNKMTVESYIPGAFFREGKEEMSARECHEKFVILDPGWNYRVIAARCPGKRVGDEIGLPAIEQKFLEVSLAKHLRVAILCDTSVLIVCGELIGTSGLLPVWIPDGDAGTIARALTLLERKDLILSPALLAVARNAGDVASVCSMLIEQFALTDRVLRPDAQADFRLLCAHTAYLAGCRAEVTELPVGDLPMTPAGVLRCVAFLLCTFLALRGESAGGPELHFGKNTRKEFRIRLRNRAERTSSVDLSDERFAFLDLPCFSDIGAFVHRDLLELEITVPRASSY